MDLGFFVSVGTFQVEQVPLKSNYFFNICSLVSLSKAVRI